ncbi:Protein of unknown function (DUF1800) [Seminavis robusta]|uniref:Uncharacterized protein n=1 Tax=Seminavis robusta TaxID=568900 RepID=A0A9N8EIR2_9STRA|nr:Protein of unknown function (DUF1800) [Seminavis robusta]|eukprot:Sro1020_g232170.1 Protein of unknown function (DUF1800) (2136) ;mRNA; r:27183-34122
MGADKKTLAIAGGLLFATIVAVAITVPLVLTKNKNEEPQQQQQQQPPDGDLIGVSVNGSDFLGGPATGSRVSKLEMQACPESVGTTEFMLEVGIDGLELFRSAADKLCTLVVVGTSGTEQFLTPIARSYNGQDWNVAAGKYSSVLTPDCTTDASLCQLVFTDIAELVGGAGATFQLTTFDPPSYSDKDIIARFLEQATFGPTWEAITEIETAATSQATSLDSQFAKWVQNQQTNVPVASHREVFRTRMNARFEVPSPNGPITQPCDAGTRHRRTAFSVKDKKKTLEIKSLPSDANRKVLLVDGQYRTTVSGPFYTGTRIKSRLAVNVEQLDWPDGTYTLNEVTYEGPYDYVMVAHPKNKKSVPFLVASTETAGAYESNPPVYYDATELTGAFDPALLPDTFGVMTLPAEAATPIDTQYFTPRTATEGDQLASLVDQEILVTADVTDALCSTAEAPALGVPFFASWNNRQYIHDPRYLILGNDVANPIADGGGSLVNEFAVPDEMFSVKCSNVPRTFLNEEGCTLSTDPNVCTYRQFETVSRQTSSEVNPNFVVSRENMRKLYEVSKDASRTAYYYVVEGVDIKRDDTVPAPCTPGSGKATKSRWLVIDCAARTEADVSATTNDYMVSRIIKEAVKEGANPYVIDAYHPKGATTRCDEADVDLKGFEVYDAASDACWRNVHTDYLNVYNFENWAKVGGHPGNTDTFNPIKQFALDGGTTLTFPAGHSMVQQWQTGKKSLGRAWKLGQEFDYYKLPQYLQTEEVASALGLTLSADAVAAEAAETTEGSNGATLVCGSPFEVGNQPSLGGSTYRGAYDPSTSEFMTTQWGPLRAEREMIWLNTVLNDEGQLRQRAAWALSQILSVHPPDVPDGQALVEPFLNYYDIFVRNAFGNYIDVLKEVSYSPIMADMLTFYGGRSTAEVYEDEQTLEFADENYAREIMQLFTTGLFQLNMDGTEIFDSTGDQEKVYSNDDIEEYARAWTGFMSQHKRGNAEVQRKNTVDPMQIVAEWRDRLPKMGLDRTYVGDGYPLCSDLPTDHFLSKGATYRLLGGQPSPELVSDPPEWNTESTTVLVSLDATSGLYQKLCSPDASGACDYKNMVILDTTIACTAGIECEVDTVRSVKVGDMYYEYLRAPCVELGFFNNAKTIAQRTRDVNAMCANPNVEAATVACCDNEASVWDEQYFGERALFASAETRCNQLLCTSESRPSCDVSDSSVGTRCYDNNYFWTSQACAVKAKIDRSNGKIAIVHQPDGVAEADVASIVQPITETYFRVDWEGDFATVLADCGNLPSCTLTDDDMCLCHVTAADTQAFSQNPTRNDVLSSLTIGSFEPIVGVAATTEDGVNVYGDLSAETIFEVVDDSGVRQLRKNTKSTVTVGDTGLSFRNPVHFMSFSDPEVRDAQYETDAALDHYAHHRNTAPFLAIRFAQRFGISNPSPVYVEEIARAFTSGVYSFDDNGQQLSFGSGTYGDLGATFAAVLLSPEARSVVLDKDPSHGSLKEPVIKIIGLMRALKFTLNAPFPWVEMSGSLGEILGQMAHQLPSVFSFFLPEYQPAGPVALGSLVAPEAQVLTGPRIIDTLNAIYAFLKYGLVGCNKGFGPNFVASCRDAKIGTQLGVGYLAYQPSTDDAVGELSTLLTAGRLNANTKSYISDFYAGESKFPLIKAQMMIATTPEFHGTGAVQQTSETRPTPPARSAPTSPYKALVYVLLAGGNDSFNMIVPHTCADTNAAGKTLLEQYKSERSTIALTDAERSRVIDATGQPCSQFAVHPDFPFAERLYNEGDLVFFANVGQLDAPVTKDDYNSVTKTDLFAHNTMQKQAQRLDPWEAQQNTGILGRMSDKLAAKGYTPQPITVRDATVATVGVPGAAVKPLVAPFGGPTEFDPAQKRDTIDMSDYVAVLNNVTNLHSSVYGETWSSTLHQAILDADQMTSAYDNIKLTQEYAGNSEGPNFMRQVEALSSLIMTRNDRGVDRDVFFLSLGGWDHHRGVKEAQSSFLGNLDSALEEFEKEMKEAGLWDSITVAVTSDFGRTLTPNSGDGSDHAWGGNYLMFGGSVKGGQILGEYPTDITSDSELNIGRGRLIPTSSWESMLTAPIQWMGLDTDEDLDYCMPNRIQTGTRLYTKDEVFNADTARSLRGN